MDAPPVPADAELAVLADVIWTQRTVMDTLACKLLALRHMLASEHRRYVGRCLDEVDAAADQLDRVEERRLVAVDALCAALGRPRSSLGLRQLADEVPEPWASVFAEHRDELRALVDLIERTAADNRRLCARTVDELDDELASLDRVPAVAGAAPGPSATARPVLRLVTSSDAPVGPRR